MKNLRSEIKWNQAVYIIQYSDFKKKAMDHKDYVQMNFKGRFKVNKINK